LEWSSVFIVNNKKRRFSEMIMHNNTLLKIALLGSVIGVGLLFLLSSSIEIDEQLISKLDEVREGELVEVSGVVVSLNDLGKVMYLDIEERKIEDVSVVLFKDGRVKVREGDYVKVIGSVEEYNGEKQIIGSKVEVK